MGVNQLCLTALMIDYLDTLSQTVITVKTPACSVYWETIKEERTSHLMRRSSISHPALYTLSSSLGSSTTPLWTNPLHLLSVSGQNFTTHLVGLLPSTSYNCCVSAVYELYRSDGVCDEINTPELFINAIACTMTRTFETNVVGGVLGFIMAILLVLLIISGAALAYLLLKRNAISAR